MYNIWSEILEILLKNLPEPFHIDTSQSNPTQPLKNHSVANHYLTICDQMTDMARISEYQPIIIQC